MVEESSGGAAGFTQGLAFNQHVGLSIEGAGGGRASGRLALRPELHNHIGTLHAAAQFALIEALSGAAAMSNLQAFLGRATPLVTGVEVTYRKLLRGDATGRATVASDATGIVGDLETEGKARFDVNVSLTDSEGVEATTAVAHWYVRMDRDQGPSSRTEGQ